MEWNSVVYFMVLYLETEKSYENLSSKRKSCNTMLSGIYGHFPYIHFAYKCPYMIMFIKTTTFHISIGTLKDEGKL
jgi:hypothetical protein